MGHKVPQKHGCMYAKLHGITYPKSTVFIAVRTSDLAILPIEYTVFTFKYKVMEIKI